MKDKSNFLYSLKLHLRALNIYLKYSKKFILVVIICALLTAISPYINIYYSSKIINELSGERNIAILKSLVIKILTLNFTMALALAYFNKVKNYLNKGIWQLEKNLLIKKFLKLDFKDVDDTEIKNKYDEYNWLKMFNFRGTRKSLIVFQSIFTSIISIFIGVRLSYSLFLRDIPLGDKRLEFLNSKIYTYLLILLFIISVILYSYIKFISSKHSVNGVEKLIFANKFIGAYLWHSNMATNKEIDLRIFKQQENIIEPLVTENNPFNEKSPYYEYSRKSRNLYILADLVYFAMVTLIYLYVCLKAYGKAFSIGEVTLYIGALTSIFIGVSKILEELSSLTQNIKPLELYFDILDKKSTMYMGSLTTEKRNDNNFDIEFKNVSFKYPGSDSYALKGVNIKFKVGSKLSVVGENGSGKTTFIKLLCRLYDPTKGEILLNGINIKKYKYDEYINLFAPVFQDYKLFSAKISENITGSLPYNEEKVMEAINKSGFIDKFKTLKNGLDTYVNKDIEEEGVDFSGGESQKLAISRAIYKNSPFLILDEPTASLDPMAEAEIYDKFYDISESKTTIFISHRLSCVKLCDKILVFSKGGVIQEGTHNSLLKEKDGKYSELWNSQSKYYA